VRPDLPNEPSHKPLRADAARNRAQVLAAARELLAARGVEVPLDAIARHAGVGAGTVHRHFPSKDSLLAAILVEDLERRAAEGLELAASDPAGGLFELLDRLLDDGLANLATKEALANGGFDISKAAPATSRRLSTSFRKLLRAAQQAGSVRPDVDVDDLRAALIGALAAQQSAASRARVARAREIVLAGLWPGGPRAG
jgi:AcrR family transcriptional regulator